ncbi:spore germination protein [Gottfriedia acidiceleris]|uniref:spore germination protein n=1 Tax=Gottfriedia acidiceleris TaxID=371036 RepID=UPI00101BA81E|nr:spore germination protein [Gottfriedia acidiceleris]
MNSEVQDFTKGLNKNIKKIKEGLHDSPELYVRQIQLDANGDNIGALLYIDGIVNTELIRESIIEPLHSIRIKDKDTFMNTLACYHIRSENVELITSISSSIEGILSGKTLVLIDGFESGILVDTAQWEQRSVEQSTRQRNIQGPLISFSEQLKVNLNLLHNIIQSPTFMVEKKKLGRIAKTDVAIVYLTDRVDQIALQEVHNRIDSLQVDYVLESRVIEIAIEGTQKTFFPLSFNTELPDAVASALYEGRIAIMVNGTPSATIVPNLFVQYFQQPSDYYVKQLKLSVRLITIISFLITILLPGFYLAFAKFHDNLVPKEIHKKFFVETVTVLPLWAEVFLLIFLLQILGIGSYKISREMILVVSLISTITIGTTAVDAKLVHPLSLIVAGLAYLTSTMLTIGTLPSSLQPIRYIFLFIGNFFGFTGLGIGLLIMIIHMSRLRSVGVPYLAPLIPFNFKEFKDVFYRGDLRKLINSPHKYPHDDKGK